MYLQRVYGYLSLLRIVCLQHMCNYLPVLEGVCLQQMCDYLSYWAECVYKRCTWYIINREHELPKVTFRLWGLPR